MMIHILLSEAHKHCAKTARYELEIRCNTLIAIFLFSFPLPPFHVPHPPRLFCFQLNFMVVF